MPPSLKRRLRPGAPASSFCRWPVDESLSQGTLAAQEILQDRLRTSPDDMTLFCEPPAGVSDLSWQHECLRQLVTDLGRFVPAMDACCSCDLMTAGSFEFLCAAHQEATPCSAVDYTVHSLDGAAANLLNPRVVQRGNVSKAAGSLQKAIFRRIYRIVAHAHFHHSELFDAMEQQQRLCSRFTAFGKRHEMMADGMFIVQI